MEILTQNPVSRAPEILATAAAARAVNSSVV
jgi:hypothetical protein